MNTKHQQAKGEKQGLTRAEAANLFQVTLTVVCSMSRFAAIQAKMV